MKKIITLVLAVLTLSACNFAEIEGNEIGVLETMSGPQEQVLNPGFHTL